MDRKIKEEISVDQLIWAIRRLPADQPANDPRVWYRTQKEHWLGWLSEYNGPGAYGRKTGVKHDARFAYNHIVCPEMLLYLIRSLPVRPELVRAAESAYQLGSSQMEKAGAIRNIVPWEVIQRAL